MTLNSTFPAVPFISLLTEPSAGNVKIQGREKIQIAITFALNDMFHLLPRLPTVVLFPCHSPHHWWEERRVCSNMHVLYTDVNGSICKTKVNIFVIHKICSEFTVNNWSTINHDAN